MEKEETGVEGIFNYNRIKIICVAIYFLLLLLAWTLILFSMLTYINDNTYINSFVILKHVIAFFVTPLVLLLIIYPLYALAYISEKSKRINEEQIIIEHLLARIAVNEEKGQDDK